MKEECCYLYIGKFDGALKVGITRDLSKRKRTIINSSGRFGDFNFTHKFPDSKSASMIEKQIQRDLKGLGYLIVGEWFSLDSYNSSIRAAKRLINEFNNGLIHKKLKMISKIKKIANTNGISRVDVMCDKYVDKGIGRAIRECRNDGVISTIPIPSYRQIYKAYWLASGDWKNGI